MYDNSTRSTCATVAIRQHAIMTGSNAESKETQARDLVGNVWHFLRLECGMTADGATIQIEMALDMARQEYNEDSD